MSPELSFFVHGTPQPGGSKRAFKHPATGRAIIVDANNKAKPWMQQVAQVAAEAIESAGLWMPLCLGPVILQIGFSLSRPKGHYASGRNAASVRASAPAYPAVKPDTTKLLRATEDALKGILWRDDAQVVQQYAWKLYDSPEGAHITVRPLLATVGAVEAEEFEPVGMGIGTSTGEVRRR